MQGNVIAVQVYIDTFELGELFYYNTSIQGTTATVQAAEQRVPERIVPKTVVLLPALH